MIKYPMIEMHHRLPQTLAEMGIWFLAPTS